MFEFQSCSENLLSDFHAEPQIQRTDFVVLTDFVFKRLADVGFQENAHRWPQTQNQRRLQNDRVSPQNERIRKFEIANRFRVRNAEMPKIEMVVAAMQKNRNRNIFRDFVFYLQILVDFEFPENLRFVAEINFPDFEFLLEEQFSVEIR